MSGRVTLDDDAARFMGETREWRQARPHWEYAAELMLVATRTGCL